MRPAPQTECRSSISDRLLEFPDIWPLRELVWFEPKQYERLTRLVSILPQQSIQYPIELRGEKRSQRVRLLISTRHYLPCSFKFRRDSSARPVSSSRRKLNFPPPLGVGGDSPQGGQPCACRSERGFYLRCKSSAARARISTRLSALSSGSSCLLLVPRARRQRLTRSPSAVRRLRRTSARSRFCVR
jgi:hypothetical protein